MKFLTALLLSMLVALPLKAATVGEPAPDFELSDQYGDPYSLDDFDGRYAYVDTLAEARRIFVFDCNFRDNIYAVRGAGADVVGVSVDSVEDQKAFSDKYKLPFPVLSDVGGQTSQAYGVLREMGSTEIAARQTFLIDPNGVVVKHYEQVDPETHTQDVVADLQSFREDYAPAG